MKNKGAFTIIEVVMVLAIAGLIFTVVFAGIPRLQSSRRDSERKNHAREIAAAVSRFEKNTGALPTWRNFREGIQGNIYSSEPSFAEYIDDSIVDPSSRESYTRVGYATKPDSGQVGYNVSYGCNSTNDDTESGAALAGSVLIGLENGTFCTGGV